MAMSQTLRFQPSQRSPATLYRRDRSNARPLPCLLRPKPSLPTLRVAVAKSKSSPIEDLSFIASQNLDSAIARRKLRSSFVEVQQGLDHCLFKMAPTGIITEEWYEKNSKGLEIFCKSWSPENGVKIRGALFFCHGYGDTCTFFFEGIAKRIASAGYVVHALDHPGFGLSDGLHGFIPSFDGLADNVIENYTKIKGRPELKSLPCFILGQSMGGAVALKVHLKEPKKWDGLILVAPMCKIAEDVKPAPAVLKALTFMSCIMPRAQLFPKKDLGALAFRDPRKRELSAYNVISYNGQTRLKTAVELLKATSDIEAQLDKVSGPLLVLHGAADRVTDPMVSQHLYENASTDDKSFHLYEDGFHCILEGEPDDRIFTVLDDIVTWLDART